MEHKAAAKTSSPFLAGLRDGVPIALGYFAVAFSLGIAARNAGLTAFQGFFASMLCVASAGEYADKVLDIDPEYAPAYIVKTCVDERVTKEEALADCRKPIEGYSA